LFGSCSIPLSAYAISSVVIFAVPSPASQLGLGREDAVGPQQYKGGTPIAGWFMSWRKEFAGHWVERGLGRFSHLATLNRNFVIK